LVTFGNPAKTAKPFEIAVSGGGSWSPGNYDVLDEGPDPPQEGAIWGI